MGPTLENLARGLLINSGSNLGVKVKWERVSVVKVKLSPYPCQLQLFSLKHELFIYTYNQQFLLHFFIQFPFYFDYLRSKTISE